MKLSKLMNILYDHFGNLIDIDPETKRKKALLKLQGVLKWFLIEDEGEFIPCDGMTDDFAGKVWRGTSPLPKDHAIKIFNNVDNETFENIILEADPSEDAIEKIIADFKNEGVTLTKLNLGNEITSALIKVLNEIVHETKKVSIRYCEIINGKVKVGNEFIKLPDPLSTPITLGVNEEQYINALLEVYSQKEGLEISSIESLEQLNPYYRTHIKMQRDSFYNAESVLHQIRDIGIFKDGVSEFDFLLNETFDGIKYEIQKPHKLGLDRVDAVLHLVVTMSYSKSFLARQNNGLIGPDEKRGLIHMLVNKGKVRWIYEYDTSF